jgi:hypothetical protein
MSQTLNDDHTYDTLYTYMMLQQEGYPVDILSEGQIHAGILERRPYRVVMVLGGAALPKSVQAAIDDFVNQGGIVFADYAAQPTDHFPALYHRWWNGDALAMQVYNLPNGGIIPIQRHAASLTPSPDARVLSYFNNNTPAICCITRGKGKVYLFGSSIGWDYTNYPGYYDLAAMFPFHVRQNAFLRRWLAATLAGEGVHPPVYSSAPEVEVALWHSTDHSRYLVMVINHLQEEKETLIEVRLPSKAWKVETALDHQPIDAHFKGEGVCFSIKLMPMQGVAFWVK